jgi:transcriptional regulator with XRE-family HTH domain
MEETVMATSRVASGREAARSGTGPQKNPGPFGILLRRWRRIRGLSQIDLAYQNNASPRHISFLETGRARPGKELVLDLANSLHLPVRDINAMLLAAGFPPMYAEDKSAASADMTLFRALVNSLVHGNTRYPCFVVDRLWQIRDVNRAMRALFHGLGVTYQVPDDKDVIDRILSQDAQAGQMINFGEIVHQFVARLRSEISTEEPDEALEHLIYKAENTIKRTGQEGDNCLTLPLSWLARFQIRDGLYSAMVGISRFSAAPHVEFRELRLVYLVPADAGSEAVLSRLLEGMEG